MKTDLTISASALEYLPKMGWYLDPSLFMDFIDRNVRRAIDAAAPDDGRTVFSIRGVSATKRQSFVPTIVGGARVTFELTSTVDRLRIIHVSNKTTFYYSELTKAEVFRAVRRAHPEREPAEIVAWWNCFRALLGDYHETPMRCRDGELSSLALQFPIQKNAQDYIHLITAKDAKLALITSDKFAGQIDELRLKFYPHVYYWPSIRNQIPILDVFRD